MNCTKVGSWWIGFAASGHTGKLKSQLGKHYLHASCKEARVTKSPNLWRPTPHVPPRRPLEKKGLTACPVIRLPYLLPSQYHPATEVVLGGGYAQSGIRQVGHVTRGVSRWSLNAGAVLGRSQTTGRKGKDCPSLLNIVTGAATNCTKVGSG